MAKLNSDITKLTEGIKVSDPMGDTYKVIKVKKNKIVLKPMSFDGKKSTYPDDFSSQTFGNPCMEEFWSFFDLV